MTGIARQGDIAIGVCPAHKSPVTYTAIMVGVSTNVFAEGAGVAYIGTVAISSCGHPAIVITGSTTVLANGMGVARIGDTAQNPGPSIIQTGAATVLAGG